MWLQRTAGGPHRNCKDPWWPLIAPVETTLAVAKDRGDGPGSKTPPVLGVSSFFSKHAFFFFPLSFQSLPHLQRVWLSPLCHPVRSFLIQPGRRCLKSCHCSWLRRELSFPLLPPLSLDSVINWLNCSWVLPKIDWEINFKGIKILSLVFMCSGKNTGGGSFLRLFSTISRGQSRQRLQD